MTKFISWLKTNILLLPLILAGTTMAQITNGDFDSDYSGWTFDARGAGTSSIVHDTDDASGSTSSGSVKITRQKQGKNPFFYQTIADVAVNDILIIRYKYKNETTDSKLGKPAVQIREAWIDDDNSGKNTTYMPTTGSSSWTQAEYTHIVSHAGTLKFILTPNQKPSEIDVDHHIWYDEVELTIKKLSDITDGMNTNAPIRMFNGNSNTDWGTNANWTGINVGVAVTGSFNINDQYAYPNQNSPTSSKSGGSIIIAKNCVYDNNETIKSYDFEKIYVLEGVSFDLDPKIRLECKTIENEGTVELRQNANEAANLHVKGASANTSGNFTVKTHINSAKSGAVKISLITPPVTGVAFNTFAADSENQDLLTKSDYTGVAGSESTILFGPYTDGSGYSNYDSSNTLELTPGIGYRTAIYTDDAAYDEYVYFRGSGINTKQTLIDISAGQWNLIGNPFLSSLSLNSLIANTGNKAKLADTAVGITYWDAAVGSFVTKIASDLETTDILARPGQAFFIKIDADATGKFNAWRSYQSITNGNTDLNRASQSSQEFELALTYNEGIKTTRIKFDEQASNGVDRGYEGEAFPDAIKDLGIYTLIADGTVSNPFAVQTVNNSNLDQLQLPLGVNALLGTYTLSIQNTNLPEGLEVILTDLVNGNETVLNKHEYTFTVSDSKLESTDRFLITFQSDALSTGNNSLEELQITAFQNTITVNGDLKNKTALKVYDLQGRLVAQKALSNNNRQLSLNNSSGIYLVNLSNAQGSKTQKVILK